MNKIKQALISVSDKSKLEPLLKCLKKFNIKIISSGNTSKKIKDLGYSSNEISNYTKFPEILSGRVKTLHPKIYGGILSRRNLKSDKSDLKNQNINLIDLVIVNFYPFEKTLHSTNNHSKIIESIDIGGSTLVRAAAKNYEYVTVISNTNQYDDLINEINKNNGSTSLDFRRKMSESAFMETGYNDALITEYFNNISKNKYPLKKLIYGKLIDNLRYGENPHQDGAIYSTGFDQKIKKLSGKKLSYNNYNDLFSALLISKSLPKNIGTVVVKHTNPCGVSINKDKVKSYKLAISSDPISAFGGIISFNFKINKKLAIELNKIFLEVIVCNGIETSALKILSKKKNLRIIDASNFKLKKGLIFSSILNSILVQSQDNINFSSKYFKIVSKKKPNSKELKSLIFAFNVCRFAKSNSIVIVKNDSTIGIGSGQSSRLDSCEIAIKKLNQFQKIDKEDRIVAASDAFFPFVDGIEKLVQAGVKAIIQPSGSIRDKEIIKFANKTGTILLFSKTRHFKH